MSLSICCLTGDPPGRVEAVLSGVRAAADEVVIGYDDRRREHASAYAALADVTFPVGFELLEAHLPELHARCSGEWVLRLDTDEVCSAALAARLPELVGDPDAPPAYAIARRWLFGTADTWIDQVPWWPDYQLRLVRRDAPLRFRADVHHGLEVAAGHAHVIEPIYHLDCLENSRRTRQAKAVLYEALDPHLAGIGGRPMHWFYDPEAHADRPLADVPEPDRPLIAAVVAGRG